MYHGFRRYSAAFVPKLFPSFPGEQTFWLVWHFWNRSAFQAGAMLTVRRDSSGADEGRIRQLIGNKGVLRRDLAF
jgi:hypothetical protein